MPITLETYSLLLQELYLGSAEELPWHRFLSSLKEILELQFAVIILRPPSENDGGIVFTSGSTIPPAMTRRSSRNYTGEQYSIDPLANLPINQLVTLEECVPFDELAATEYYKLYLEPMSIRHVIGIDLMGDNGQPFNVRITRRASKAPFSDSEKDFLRLLMPHIQAAVSQGVKLQTLDSERKAYANSIAARSVGTLTLTDEGHILHANDIAEAFLQEKDGIWQQHQQLHLKGDLNKLLKQHILDIVNAQAHNQPIAVRALSIPRSSGQLDYELILKPVPLDRYLDTPNTPHVIVFIYDPEKNLELSAPLICTLFQLSKAESLVAVLLTEGKSLEEVAEFLGIAKNTARAQLRSIFSKTGVSRQSSLVSLLLKSLASAV